MKLQQSVQLADDLHQALKGKAQAERRSVRAVVDAALRAQLDVETVCPTCRRAWGRTWDRTSGTLDVVATTGGTASLAVPTMIVRPVVAKADAARCRKCGHDKQWHFKRGCVAGCACAASRFQA